MSAIGHDLLQHLDTPEKWREWLDETANHLRYSRARNAGRGTKEREDFENLADGFDLLREGPVESREEFEALGAKSKEDHSQLDTLVRDLLQYIHESHDGLQTTDPKLCQHVECSRLRRDALAVIASTEPR